MIKNRPYILQAWIAAILILLGNPISVKWGLHDEFLEEKVLPFVLMFDLLALVTFLFLLREQKGMIRLFRESPSFNLWFTFFFFLAIFASNRVFTGKMKPIRLLFMLLLLLQYGRTFVMWVVRNPFGIPPVMRNLATGEFLLGVVFLLSEMIFMFPAKSRGAFPDSFSQINWNLKFLGNLNSMGMREEEIPPIPPSGKKTIFFLGDSFCFGWGIESRESRMPEFLEKNLKVEAYDLGVPGGDITDQVHTLEKISWRPDALILYWNPNDIHRAAAQHGIKFQGQTQSMLHNWPQFITHYSYTFNWIAAEWLQSDPVHSYPGYLNQAFTNAKVMESHLREWGPFAETARDSAGIPVLAVLFPLPGSPKASVPWLSVTEEWLNHTGLAVLNLGPLLENYSPEELSVNSHDQHPNEMVLEILGDTLLKRQDFRQAR